MKRLFIFIAVLVFVNAQGQVRNVNKMTLEATYAYTHIQQSLRDVINGNAKERYFDDAFFNEFLKKMVSDKHYSAEEKVKLFYLMLKKIGYAFNGIEYLPPKHNYFNYHQGKVYILQQTRALLKDLNYNTSGLLSIVDSNCTKDPVLASNALLLATLLSPTPNYEKLQQFSAPEFILKTKNPDIFNHYVCLSASITQDSLIRQNLERCALTFTVEGMVEDAICAIYSRNHKVSFIATFIYKVKNPQHDLAIQTALCALASKVPDAAFQQSVQKLILSCKEKWKNDLLKDISLKKTPYNYSLSSPDQLVTKLWDGVVMSNYLDGILISNGKLMEFDPN